jgi:ribosomal protein L29
MMKQQELAQQRQKSHTELLSDLAQAQHELVAMRLSRAQGKVSNVRTLSRAKRKIAQLSTLIAQKKA